MNEKCMVFLFVCKSLKNFFFLVDFDFAFIFLSLNMNFQKISRLILRSCN